MADFQYQVQPSTATGLLSGVQAGMNAATMIQENRMRRQQMDANAKQAKDAEERLKMTDGLALLKESWVPEDYKLQLYKNNVQPYFEARGKALPELAEWDPGHNKLAKELADLYEKGSKAGMPIGEIETAGALAMAKYEKQFRESGEPFLASLKNRQDNEAKVKAAEATQGRGEANLDFRKGQAVRDFVKRFNADPAVRKIEAVTKSARDVRSLATSSNPIAQDMIPTMLAKLSGDVGNIPEAYKEDLKGDKSIMSTTERILQRKASGKPLTPTDVAYMSKVADMLEAAAADQKRAIARERSAQESQTPGFPDEESLFGMLMPASKASPAKAPAAGGATHRWNPETGKVEAVQ